jgi:hypothetical protein
MTEFSQIYDVFFGKITDDMYLEWTKEDTEKDCRSMLINVIPNFEFPRVNLTYTENSFDADLTAEEVNILATLMVIEWLGRQINSIELTRMKYYGSDFKMTSQANHLSRLQSAQSQNKLNAQHLQRLYRRRKPGETKTEAYKSNWSVFRKSALD